MSAAATSYPTGTVTFLFTDIGGSTRLWEQAPEAMREALALHDAILRAAIEMQGGVVFKTVGDAMYAAFTQPDAAIAAAVAAQRGLREQQWPPAVEQITVRMAIHTGVAIATNGDYFGPPLNRVSRLTSLAFPGQILVSRSSATLAVGALAPDVSLRTLGVYRLKDLSEAEETSQVIAEGLQLDFPPLPSLDARPNNLPFEIASFVGRTAESADLREQLTAKRIITVVGTGGIGKTRLALQAAADVIERFPDGAWFVELASVGDLHTLAQAIAVVLNVQEEAQRPLEDSLADAIGTKEMLLILDGVDRVIDGTAALVKKLLSRCPSLRVVVTSRQPLHLTGERTLRLGALSDALQLFLERARESDPDALSGVVDENVINLICRRLDGIPLAIELAAAHVARLSLNDILERLQKSMKLLVSRDSTKEERHRTLRAAIAWSYDLLGEAEATALRGLAIFQGTFDLWAAASVLASDEDDTQDLIDELAIKSMLWAVGGVSPSRYVLMTTVREYLVDITAQSHDGNDWPRRHFEYFREVVADGRGVDRQTAPQWLARIDTDVANIRGALEWALKSLPREAAAMVVSMAAYWKARGFLTEARLFLKRADVLAFDDDGLRAQVLRRAASFAIEQDDYEDAHVFNNACRALYEASGNISGIAETLFNRGLIEQRSGQESVALRYYDEAISSFRRAGNAHGEVVVGHNTALLLLARGELDQAQSAIDAAVVALASSPDEVMIAHFIDLRGSIAFKRGEFEHAEALYREALATQIRLGHSLDVATLYGELAFALAHRNRAEEAAASARACLEIGRKTDSSSLLICGFEAFCEIALEGQNYEEAARHFALAQILRRTQGFGAKTMRDNESVARILGEMLGDRLGSIVNGVESLGASNAVVTADRLLAER